MQSLSRQIRLIELADAPALCAIYNHAVAHTTATMDTEPRPIKTQEEWIRSHQGDPFPAWVALNPADNTEVVGYASLSPYNPKLGYRTSAEVSVYVHPDYQGQGIGQQLLTYLIAEAPRYGFVTLVSLITADNQVSLHLHQKLGFTTVGTLTKIARKFDQWVDVVTMQYSFC